MDFFSVILSGLFAKSVGALIAIGLLAGLTVIVRRRLHDKSDGEEILAEQALVHDKSDYRVFYSDVYVIHFYIPDRDTVVNCEVSRDLWQGLERNYSGVLVHQGGKFISFNKSDLRYGNVDT